MFQHGARIERTFQAAAQSIGNHSSETDCLRLATAHGRPLVEIGTPDPVVPLRCSGDSGKARRRKRLRLQCENTRTRQPAWESRALAVRRGRRQRGSPAEPRRENCMRSSREARRQVFLYAENSRFLHPSCGSTAGNVFSIHRGSCDSAHEKLSPAEFNIF